MEWVPGNVLDLRRAKYSSTRSSIGRSTFKGRSLFIFATVKVSVVLYSIKGREVLIKAECRNFTRPALPTHPKLNMHCKLDTFGFLACTSRTATSTLYLADSAYTA